MILTIKLGHFNFFNLFIRINGFTLYILLAGRIFNLTGLDIIEIGLGPEAGVSDVRFGFREHSLNRQGG